MSQQPVIFGEVLFDCFPGNKQVLGGAPFNVAWHLQGFGCNPLFVSAVGSDELGRRVLDAVSGWFSQEQAIEVHSEYPTGTVEIKFNNNTHSFDIRNNQAYDVISGETTTEQGFRTHPSVLYHGTLALRSEISRKTLASLRNSVSCSVFVDLNLRAPWWNKEIIADALCHADFLKLNDDELALVSEKKLDSLEATINEAHSLTQEHNISTVIVTRGAHGAFVVQSDGATVQAEPVPVAQMVDTVGAGDAFSAVWLLGSLKAWPVQTSLQRASSFASAICEMSGATSSNLALYTDFLEAWEGTNG